MNLEDIQAIIKQINQSDIREIDLNYQDIHLYLNKNKTSHPTTEVTNEKAATSQATPAPASPKPTEKVVDLPVTAPKSTEQAIKAPLVGVIYLQSAPDKPAYKKVGDHVEVGDVVCVIEAMKMMTEIKSKVAGTITEILVENEEVVEFDQPLFTVTQ